MSPLTSILDRPQPSSKDTNAMTMTMTRPTQTNEHEASASATRSSSTSTGRASMTRVTKSEWLKFRTVRSNMIALGSAAAAAIGFGALFSSLAGSGTGPDNLANNGLALSLGGFQLSQIIVAILGVALVASEYQTGLIRTWFGAAPDRMRVLFAKVGVFGSLVFVSSMIAAVVAFLIGQELLPSDVTAAALGDDGVFQALAGQAFYMACIGIIGIGLGFLLRSTAAGAGVVVAMLMIAPLMVSLLPSSIGDVLNQIMPSNAGSAVQGIETGTELLSTGGGIAVLLCWVVGIVGAAAISLQRRDA